MNELPKIAILTMAFNPMNTAHAVINALEQTYPNKKLYLMRQEPCNPVDHSFDLEIEECIVKGHWPKLWAFKFVKGLTIIREPITAIMDEDDRFRADYLEVGIRKILSGEADVTCNMENIDIRPFQKMFMHRDKCSVGTGTLIGKTEVLREMWNGYIKAGGEIQPRVKQGLVPADGPFFRYISGDPRLKFHEGIRYYFWHPESQCKSHRKVF
jgi:hypothetical protein